MPALAAAMSFDDLLDVHRAIIASIPPDEMATTLALILPAMNLDDRTEMLGGMKADAPAEIFTNVLVLAQSVLAPSEYRAVTDRLDAT